MLKGVHQYFFYKFFKCLIFFNFNIKIAQIKEKTKNMKE